MTEKMLRTAAELQITAAADADKPAVVRIKAYGGGTIKPPGFGETLIALDGLQLPASVPLLGDHENRLDSLAGNGTPTIQAGELLVDGTISRASRAGAMIVGLAKDGVTLSASVGVELLETEHVAGGKTVRANGKTFTAPKRGLLLVKRGFLREVSFTPIGADPSARVDVAASHNGNGNMEGENETSILERERQRVAKIEAACKGDWRGQQPRVDELKAKAISDEISFENLQANMLEILRAARPKALPISGVGSGHADLQPEVITASYATQLGVPEKQLGHAYGEQVMNLALDRRMRTFSLHDLFRTVLEAAGQPSGGKMTPELIRAAYQADAMLRASGGGFSTISIGGILSGTANAVMVSSFEAVGTTWQRLARPVTVDNFLPQQRYRMVGTGSYQPIASTGEIKHIGLSETLTTLQASTEGCIIQISRKDVINDQLGALADVPRILGRLGAVSLEKSFYVTMFANPGNFFAAGNKNITSGAGSALSIAAVTALSQLVMEQLDNRGEPAMITPTFLLTPPSLATTAASLVSATEILKSTTSGAEPNSNPHAGKFTAIQSPWLGVAAGAAAGLPNGTAGDAGYSDTAWYLFASPADVPAAVVSFLGGKQTPTIETGQPDFDTLGIAMRAYHDFGFAFEEPRSAARARGV